MTIYDRLADSSMTAPAALAGVAVGVFMPDAFFWLFIILACTNIFDWLLGRHAARAKGTYNRTRARSGLVAKAAQMVILVTLRSLEWVLTQTDLPSTVGLVSAAIALALIVEDVESMERHGIVLGGKPIPGLSPILTKIRAITGSERRRNEEAPPADVGERRVPRRRVS